MKNATWWDRLVSTVAPQWAMKRSAARVAARHYEAAATGRRTSGWARNRGDANAVMAVAIPELRLHARDLVRNNGWAKRAQRIIANNTVGFGVVPKADSEDAALNKEAQRLWKLWADTTQCDVEGRHSFGGVQHAAMKTIVEAGEVLIRRRWRKASDGLAVPMQLQVLEPDYLDILKDGDLPNGGWISMGVEYGPFGQRVAYWLFPAHPGSVGLNVGQSRRVPASEIVHAFYSERPEASRGISWYGTAIVNMKDLDEYDDAELMKQKIAACFAAFTTDVNGAAPHLGEEDEEDESTDTFEPGMIANLTPGRDVKFANPPGVTSDTLPTRNLRKIAAGLGVTYEDMTGDYSQVNFSSARMGRLSHQANITDWQWNMIIPQVCGPVWDWFAEAAQVAGLLREPPPADWTVQPMPMIEPDKEGLALQRLVRGGTITFSEMLRQQGRDPEAHWAEYKADCDTLDTLKIKLDSDVRAVSQAGLTQERAGLGEGGKPGDGPPGEKPPEKEEKPGKRALLDVIRGIG